MVESANVIAKWQGSDPKLAREYVVLSAHIDHLLTGMSPEQGGDYYADLVLSMLHAGVPRNSD